MSLGVGKLIGIAGTALKSNVVKLGRPYKLNFCITYNCQSRCRTCNIWQMRPKGELTIEEIRKLAAANPYFKWIELTGGEPFLRSDIAEIAKAFKEHSDGLYILTMPTNSLCDHSMVESKLRQILDLGIPRVAITVSLDGYKELHDMIRGIPGNYEKAIDMFKRLKELRKSYSNLYFVFGYTLSKLNMGKFEETFQAVKRDIPDIKYNDFHINLAQISTNYYNNGGMDITPNDPVVVKEISDFIDHREPTASAITLIENAFLRRLLEYAKTGVTPMPSRSLEASVYLDSFGNVFPSIMWDMKIGNVRDTNFSLEQILRGEQAKRAIDEKRKGKEPQHWTSCEAYQSLTGSVISILS